MLPIVFNNYDLVLSYIILFKDLIIFASFFFQQMGNSVFFATHSLPSCPRFTFTECHTQSLVFLVSSTLSSKGVDGRDEWKDLLDVEGSWLVLVTGLCFRGRFSGCWG